jgi:hypothetical protein
MRFNFHFGRRRPNIKQWAAYSIGTATAVGLIVHYGNMLLASKHGEFIRDAICAASKVVPDGDIARLMSTLCRVSKDGTITPEEAKTALGRAQQATGKFDVYFDNDRENTDLRAVDEVDFAIEGWKRLNPSPKIDPSLRAQHPEMGEEQLCVLSQAERYTDGDAIGIRYVGMGVCENEE